MADRSSTLYLEVATLNNLPISLRNNRTKCTKNTNKNTFITLLLISKGNEH